MPGLSTEHVLNTPYSAPPLRDLEPLLHSQHLEFSLLILATHQPPEIPLASTIPAVRVLRLSAPLAIEDAGAVRFVNVLECAERVARVWRKSGGVGIEELSEAELDGAKGPGSLSPPNVFRFVSSGSAPSSPQSSTERVNSDSSLTVPSRRLRSSSSTSSKIYGQSLPPVDSSQRPFDCILNFLPVNSSDKAILKQSILVTTISRPFVTGVSNPTRPATARNLSKSSFGGGATEDGRRWSKILHRNSMYSAPTTPSNRSRTSLYSSPGASSFMTPPVPATPRRAHIVHLIPPASPSVSRIKLMESMESFLCSFAYPTTLEIGQPDAAGMERAAPFLMYPYTLRSSVRSAPHSNVSQDASLENVSSEWTIADLLLSGALDRATGAGEGEKSPPRAWINSASDIVFVPASQPGSMRSVNVTPPMPTSTIRGRHRDNSWNGSGTANDSCSGTVESSTHGTGSESGMMTPELTPPPTPETIIQLPVVNPPAPLEKVRLITSHTTDKALPTPPDSEESDSTGSSSRHVSSSTKTRPISVFIGPKKLSKREGAVKQGKTWSSKWKFWKVSLTTASA